MQASPVDGPWEPCPHCSSPVLLSAFADADDEPGVLVALCRICARLVTAQPPVHPGGA